MNNMKQETLEEAAHEYYKRGQLGLEKTADTETAFVQGAEWQQERMYSEEDLKEAFRQGMENMDYSEIHGWSSKLTEQEWFQDFKKK